MKNKFITIMVTLVMALSMTLTVFAAPSPESKEVIVTKLFTVTDVSAPSVEGHEYTFATHRSNVKMYDLVESVLSENQKIECLVDISAYRDGHEYHGECDNVSLNISNFAVDGDVADYFRVVTLTDHTLEAVEIVSYDATTKTLVINMPHFSQVAIIRVDSPHTGDVNTTPYWIAIGGCIVALGAVAIFGKRKKRV